MSDTVAKSPVGAGEAHRIGAEYWASDHRGQLPVSWLEHPAILDFVYRRISGDPKVSTYQWFKDQFFPRPVELCLSLGCGFGGFERAAISLGIARRFHANDLSPGAIATARRFALDANMADQIDYDVLDLNGTALPPRAYDAIFAVRSAHHVDDLENLFRQCRLALKPGCLMFLDEYIGPSRLQTPPLVTDIINRLLLILPKRYRASLFANDGTTIDRYVPSPIEHFLVHDPSDAVRSAEIIEALKQEFDIVVFRPWGGAILHMLLSGIVGNFASDNETDVALLQMLATFEEILEEQGVIVSDFATIVAKPKQ